MGTRRIRDAVRRRRYEFTLHALEEMDEDDLAEIDVRSVLIRGRRVARMVDDPRGVRFAVRGPVDRDGRSAEVVCRFLPSGLLRIITAYRVEN